ISLLAVAYSHNWHLLFIAGGLAGLLMVPLLWWKLPESEAFLVAREAKRNPAAASATVRDDADPSGRVDAQARTGMAGLFEGSLALVPIGVGALSFRGLLLVYGLNSWLPKIMADAGYAVSDSLVMLFVMNIAAVVGLVLAGWLADQHGTKKIVLLWFVLAAVFLAALSIPMTSQ